MGLKRQDYEEDEILDCEILVRKAMEEKEKAYAPYSDSRLRSCFN